MGTMIQRLEVMTSNMNAGFKRVDNRMVGMSKEFDDKLDRQREEIEKKIKELAEGLGSEPKRRRKEVLPLTPISNTKKPTGGEEFTPKPRMTVKANTKHSSGDIPITPAVRNPAAVLASTPATNKVEDIGSSLEDLSDILTALSEEEKKAIEAMEEDITVNEVRRSSAFTQAKRPRRNPKRRSPTPKLTNQAWFEARWWSLRRPPLSQKTKDLATVVGLVPGIVIHLKK